MEEKFSILYSHYLLDGIQMESTPAVILNELCLQRALPVVDCGEQIVDETLDHCLDAIRLDVSGVNDYLGSLLPPGGELPLPFAGICTKCRVATALLDCIWRLGHFKLEDLSLYAEWTWNPDPVGSKAAFYYSVSNAAEYIDGLGLALSGYSCASTGAGCRVDFSVDLLPPDADAFATGPEPKMAFASIPSTFLPDPTSWVIYIPFETSDYRLGGSLLARSKGMSGGVELRLDDPDYFLDCYEVVRELVEDGIVLAGATISEGGLIAAADSMTSRRVGVELSLSDLKHSTGEDDEVRLLFAEVPGVIVQIRDDDFDYLDAELLLQDVAFYPIGHPVSGGGVKLTDAGASGLQNILQSLIHNTKI